MPKIRPSADWFCAVGVDLTSGAASGITPVVAFVPAIPPVGAVPAWGASLFPIIVVSLLRPSGGPRPSASSNIASTAEEGFGVAESSGSGNNFLGGGFAGCVGGGSRLSAN